MTNGKAALAAWGKDIMASDSITVGETWEPVRGWRCALMLSTGKTLVMSPREMRMLAESFIKGGGRAIGIDDVLDDMLACADEMKAKNARKEIPVGFMPDAGSA